MTQLEIERRLGGRLGGDWGGIGGEIGERLGGDWGEIGGRLGGDWVEIWWRLGEEMASGMSCTFFGGGGLVQD